MNEKDIFSRENGYPLSPVPEDDRLVPGELPFTAFGQHGVNKLDKRVFEQDIYWVDYLGHEHLLVEMENSYLRNVRSYLKESVDIFYAGAIERFLAIKISDSLLGRINMDEVVDHFGIPNVTELSPSAWLESTPLFRKLEFLINKQ